MEPNKISRKKKDKLYTLEEAYAEILRIKEESIGKDYQTKQEKEAYKQGYSQAIIDMQIEFQKNSQLLLNINKLQK